MKPPGTTITPINFAALPKTYAQLIAFFMPRPLHDRADLDNTVEIIDALAGHSLIADQEEYLDLLVTLVEDYERRHVRFPKKRGTPLQRLKFLMRQTGMKTADLGRLLDNSGLASQIMLGRRELSKTHIRLLADHFRVSPALFF